MTKIGKALTLLLTVLSVYLLTIAATVVLTPMDWRGEIARATNQKGELDKKIADYEAITAAETQAKAAAEGRLRTALADFKTDFDRLDEEANKAARDTESTRAQLARLGDESKDTLDAARAEAAKVDETRARLEAVIAQREAFEAQNQLLDDRIATLTRELRVAEQNREDLRTLLRDATGSVGVGLREGAPGSGSGSVSPRR